MSYEVWRRGLRGWSRVSSHRFRWRARLRAWALTSPHVKYEVRER